ncbi:unnamed protein product [Caenorhabditis nigoni]
MKRNPLVVCYKNKLENVFKIQKKQSSTLWINLTVKDEPPFDCSHLHSLVPGYLCPQYVASGYNLMVFRTTSTFGKFGCNGIISKNAFRYHHIFTGSKDPHQLDRYYPVFEAIFTAMIADFFYITIRAKLLSIKVTAW